MSGALSSVGNFIKGGYEQGTNFLLGGGPKERNVYGDMSPQASQNVHDLQGNIGDLYSQQGQDANQFSGSPISAGTQKFQDQFQQHLVDFLTKSDQGSNPTPEQLAQATDFVDKTFTTPTQNALKQYQGDFAASQDANAAALGRDPNTDVATKQAIYGEGLRNTINLQANRASQIAQTAQGLNTQDFNRSAQGAQEGYYGNQALLNNSNFLSQLQQKAFSNQLNLLNGRSNLASLYQNQSMRQRDQTPGRAGFLANLNSVGTQTRGLLGGGQSGADPNGGSLSVFSQMASNGGAF